MTTGDITDKLYSLTEKRSRLWMLLRLYATNMHRRENDVNGQNPLTEFALFD